MRARQIEARSTGRFQAQPGDEGFATSVALEVIAGDHGTKLLRLDVPRSLFDDGRDRHHQGVRVGPPLRLKLRLIQRRSRPFRRVHESAATHERPLVNLGERPGAQRPTHQQTWKACWWQPRSVEASHPPRYSDRRRLRCQTCSRRGRHAASAGSATVACHPPHQWGGIIAP